MIVFLKIIYSDFENLQKSKGKRHQFPEDILSRQQAKQTDAGKSRTLAIGVFSTSEF